MGYFWGSAERPVSFFSPSCFIQLHSCDCAERVLDPKQADTCRPEFTDCFWFVFFFFFGRRHAPSQLRQITEPWGKKFKKIKNAAKLHKITITDMHAKTLLTFGMMEAFISNLPSEEKSVAGAVMYLNSRHGLCNQEISFILSYFHTANLNQCGLIQSG